MTGKDLLDFLSKLPDVDLEREVMVLLCDTKYPTGDGDYDNAYYDYDSISIVSIVNGKIQIFGYIR